MASHLSAFLYGEKVDDREPFTLFDVGCSGGVGSEWDIFGSSLRATGFDPLEYEIERLKQAERRPHIRYEAAFVGLNSAQEKERLRFESALSEADKFYPGIYSVSSASKAAEILSYDYRREHFNYGVERTYSSYRISLDEFVGRHSITGIDFLKTDTDGHDVEVLIGADKLVRSTLLGAKVECFFHRPNSPYETTFANVDRIMTSKGFYLFDIKPHTYTRAVLPGPFEYEILASTTNGAPIWADVLYLRDLAHRDYDRLFAFDATPERIIKTACVMECFGLHDCAAELILNRIDRLPYSAEQMLDLLVPDTLGRGLFYRDYMQRFAADPKALLPSRLRNKRPELPMATAVPRELSLAHAVSYPEWGATLEASANGGLFVTTSHHKWGYAMVLPLPEHNGTGVLAVELEVVEGHVGISVANAGYTQLASETLLSAARKKSTIIMPVSPAAETHALMIRNALREEPSRAIISHVTLFAD